MTHITLHDYARDVAAVVEREKAGPAILAGHAFGHFVAKMTAVDYPNLVRAVILIGAAQKHPDPDVQKSVAIASDPAQPEAERLEASAKSILRARATMRGRGSPDFIPKCARRKSSRAIRPRRRNTGLPEQLRFSISRARTIPFRPPRARMNWSESSAQNASQL